MKSRGQKLTAALILSLLFTLAAASARAQQTLAARLVPKFPLAKSGLELERRTHPGAFLDVLGRKSAVFGYEHRQLEAWVYPLEVLDDFDVSFRLEGYPLELSAADTSATINVRPEATTITYSHAAFTVRQIILAPLDEPGVVMLFDVDSVLPLTLDVRFRPRLKLMWPAGMMTGNLSWDERERAYFITEETGRFVGMIGSPAARDSSVQPYQEEPRDVPAQFQIAVAPGDLKSNFIPVVIAGSIKGRDDARAAYARMLGSVRELYEKNVERYRRLLQETTTVITPDERVNQAFEWAKVGIDKSVVENPLLGTGLVAGFRTAGESERPGFAWFFGRDSMWTALALDSYGDFEDARAALEFLKKFQRADGKIPHEISQSASLVPWFTDYPYPFASADATPLYIIAHADYLRSTGDVAFTRADWDSILKAYRFTTATDTDGNGLVENTKFGHGWVEGGALYPPHEEIYMQGLWVEASRDIEEMATLLKDAKVAAEAHAAAERTREAAEKTYWLPRRGFYAFATNQPRATPREADPGPNRERRQQRMNELDKSEIVDEDTVLPAVPLWWHVLEDERAQEEIDHLGSGHLATDWGARIISDESRLYDPLSYHNGSVWPLFTGWASVGAYRYGRPHVGFQSLMSNVLLDRQNALGYVTELLSGDFDSPFGRSSHHQVWSEAMTVEPIMRGLLGIEVSDLGKTVRFAPQLPPDWNSVEVRRVHAGNSLLDFSVTRADGEMTILLHASDDSGRVGTKVLLAPAFPLDARVLSVKDNDRTLSFKVEREGDIQRVEFAAETRRINFSDGAEQANIVINYEGGTDVYVERETPRAGDSNVGLRVLRSRAENDALQLLLEGLAGHEYSLRISSPKQVGLSSISGESATSTGDDLSMSVGSGDPVLGVKFDGEPGRYVRREVTLSLRTRAEPARKRKPNQKR
ncbi:MAG TPA: GH116 family glycosyl hydrolase [Pyrinomonadaceae bacterium]|nr:GH116 family glycosyl hydrolase [Pyrinomonadaceae bacterium]